MTACFELAYAEMCQHVGHRLARGQVGAGQIDGEQAAPQRLVRIGEFSARGLSGVVDQQVHGPEAAARGGESALHRWRIGKVGHDRKRPALAAQIIGYTLQIACISSEKRHAHTFAGHPRGDDGADSAACARDDGMSAGELRRSCMRAHTGPPGCAARCRFLSS